MQVSKIMLAVAALSLGATTFAAPLASRIAISSGASATKGNLKVALTSLCSAGSGTLTEFTSGGNISTYVCADVAVTAPTYGSKPDANFKNFSGTGFAELRLNVSGGSFTAVCALNNWPAGTACDTVNPLSAPDKYLNPASGTTVLPAAGQVIVGGLMDVAPDTFPATVTVGLTLPAADLTGVAQTFGVAASDTLYTAMFNVQKSAGGATLDKPIPSTCLVTDTARLECVPVVSKGQMATILANNPFNDAYTNGAGFLAGAALNSTILEYNRRVDTSGTQASAQAYFLGLPCTGNPLSIVAAPPVGTSTTIGAIKVFAHAGTGDVRARLSTAGVYGIGIMSGENNQTDTGTTWKWLRMQGAAIGENAKPSTGVTNSASVKNGSYDYYFESRVVPGPAAGASTFWSAVTGTLNTLPAPVGLLNATDLTAYNKGGNACQYNSR